MTAARKTTILAVVAGVLLVLNLIGTGTASITALPSLPSVPPDSVTRVRLWSPIEEILLNRTHFEAGHPEQDRWAITSPLDFPADAAAVRSLLRIFGPGVPMEAQVDDGHLEDYGVDDQHGRLLELYTEGTEPALAVVIGKAAAGTASFVRIPGSDRVYRANLGGRNRIDRPAADWRDKIAFDVDPTQVVEVVLNRGGETLRLERGPPQPAGADGKSVPGDWTLAAAPFPIDRVALDGLVRTLTRIRAGEIHHADYPADFAHPAATATLALTDGSSHTVVLGGASDTTATLIRVDDRPEVFRTSAALRRQLLQPLSALRDRTLFNYTRAEIASVSLAEGGLSFVLSQGADGTWSITQPANMDVDQRQALFTVDTLASLRASSFAPDRQFAPAGTRFLLRLTDGRTTTLEVGTPERDPDGVSMVRVRVGGQAEPALVKEMVIRELKKAFGRG